LNHQILGTELISVSLAELNQIQRRSLESLARQQGFELLAIYDRSFFAASLSSRGEWRKRLLGLPGAPYSLSRMSDPARPSLEPIGLVGREDETRALSTIESDLVVWGVAGAGKTAVLEERGDLVFVQGDPSDERLLDDLLDADPLAVVVDDAGSRTDLLGRLRAIRAAEHRPFRIIAVCWPHELATMDVHLPEADRLEIGLLTRSEIAELVRARGVTNRIVLQRVLAQAMGRAGWATHLTDLFKDERTRQSVFDGVAIEKEVIHFLVRAGLPLAASDLLSVLGLLGRTKQPDVNTLAERLGIPRVDLAHHLNLLATGGLIDVTTAGDFNGDAIRSFEVVPELLALSIAGTMFTKPTASTSPPELIAWIPDARVQVVERTIKCALMGIDQARAPAHAVFRSALDGSSRLYAEPMKLYALLGDSELEEVMRYLKPMAEDEIHGVDEWHLRSPLATFFDVLTEAARYKQTGIAANALLDLLIQCEGVGRDIESTVRSYVDAIRGFEYHDLSDLTELKALASAAIARLHLTHTPESQSVLIHLIEQVMQPSFDSTRMSVTDSRTIEMRSGWLNDYQMHELDRDVWAPFERLSLVYTKTQAKSLCVLTGKWARIARGYSPRRGGEPDEATQKAARQVVSGMVSHLLPSLSDSPGLRADLRDHVQALIEMPESDPFLHAVFDVREPGHDWRAFTEQRRKDILLTAPIHLQGAREWCSFLSGLRDQMADSGQFRWIDAISLLLREKADFTAEPGGWLEAIVEYELVREAQTVVRGALDAHQIGVEVVRELTDRDDIRSILIAHVLHDGLRSPYSTVALAAVRVEDAAVLELDQFRGDASEDVLCALLESADPPIRTATAAAVIAAAREERPPSEQLLELAIPALKDLEIPVPYELRFEHKFMENFRDLAPAEYVASLEKVALLYVRDHAWRALDSFGSTPSGLPRHTRRRIWQSLPPEYRSPHLLMVLAGADIEWLGQLLETGDADHESVISAAANSEVIPVADLARLVIPYGADPVHVAVTVRYGTRWGEEHERLAGHIEELRTLAKSPEPELRLVGEAGVNYFAKEFAEAKARARRTEVTGTY
jgi:hypothetical protein